MVRLIQWWDFGWVFDELWAPGPNCSMRAQGTLPRLRLIETGPVAVRKLAPIAVVEVFASLSGCIYAMGAPGSASGNTLVCIGPPALGSGALNMIVTEEEWRRTRTLRIGDQVTLDCRRAAAWRPESPNAVGGVDPRALGVAKQMAPRLTLNAGAIERRIWASLSEGLDALAHWLGQSHTPPPQVVLSLLGVGAGLTPAWDDVLVGVLLAARGQLEGHHRVLANALTPARLKRTSAISCAHLRAACDGFGVAVAHGALGALFSPYNSATVTRLRELATHGGSSGEFCLAGMSAVAAASAEAQMPGFQS